MSNKRFIRILLVTSAVLLVILLASSLIGRYPNPPGMSPDLLFSDPLARQLLAGELPLTLAYLFGEIAPCRKLGRQARRELSAGLVELLDGEGLPHAEHLLLLRPLLACWTRCRAIGNESAKG